MRGSLISPRKLQHIVTLASHGSYVSAARALNISPSALSKSVHSLEEDLNLVLFTRGKGGVFSTPAGERVLIAAHRLLESLSDMEDSISGLGEAELGDAAFGVAPILSSVLLPPLFRQIIAERKLRAQVIIEPGERLLELLNAGRIEFFISTEGAVGRIPHISLESVGALPLSLRVREGHPLAQKRGVLEHELSRFPLVGGTFRTNARLRIFPHRPYEPVVFCDNYQILAQAVRDSDARCNFPAMVPTEGLVDLDCAPGAHMDSIALVACRPRSRRLSRSGKAAFDRIQALLAELGLSTPRSLRAG